MLPGKPSSVAKSLAPAEPARRLSRTLRGAFDALVTGSRTVPMGDNGALLRELCRRSGTARVTDR